MGRCSKGGLVCVQELGGMWQAGQRCLLKAATAEIETRLAVPVDEAVNKARKLQTRSHPLFSTAPPDAWAPAAIMTILPSLAISIRPISTPAAFAALMARVTSCCRNVDGARAMTATRKPAYRSMLRARRAPTVRWIRLSQSGPPVRLDAGAQAHKLGWRRV